MRSASQFSFAQVPQALVPRSKFDQSRTYKTTLDAGYLYPIFLQEILPGSTLSVDLTAFMRMTTPVVPIMDNLIADFFFFEVPNRLVSDNWEHLCGARDNPVADYSQDTQYLVPQVTPKAGQGFVNGSLADYFGLPTDVAGISVCAYPFRAYNLIWNEWFRDENLQNQVQVDMDDTTVDDTNYQLLRRGKRHDYARSCLPWPQKGPGVEIPLGGMAPVVGTGMTLGLTDGINDLGPYANNANLGVAGSMYGQDVGHSTVSSLPTGIRSVGVTDDPEKSGLAADLSEATAATINSLREAFQIQKMYERDARGGNARYTEILRSHFGVISPDARLQRPEYLGGGSIPVNIHAVTQTSSSSVGTTPQGNLAATATAAGHVGFQKSFVEHGYVIGLVSIRQGEYLYQNGIDRHWSRQTRFDFYWPSLAHLGEQAVLNKEIYAQGTSADDQVFGYQERWAEYRYGVSHITGQLRSNYAQSLDVWHLAEKFTSLPTLSSTFIEENPPVARALAVQNRPQFLYDSLVKVQAVLPLPTYSVPGGIDHM